MRDRFIEKISIFNDSFRAKINKFMNLSIEKRITIISMLILILSIFVMISMSSGISTKEEVISNFKTAIENKDVKLLSKTLKVDNKRVNYENLIPIMNYYHDKMDTLLDVTKKLRADNKSGMLQIESKKNILAEEYYLNINKVSVEVKSNFNDTEVTIDNKTIKSGEILENIIPGNYVASYKLKTDFGFVTGENEVTITDQDVINISVDAGNITIYSDYKDADVFIGNKNIGKKVESVVNFGPIPLNRDISIYIEKEFPWGKIKSETLYINDSGIIKLNIDMVNEKLMSDIDILLNDFFDSVFNALNEEDESLIINANEDTKDKIYDDIFKKTLFFTNNYRISDMNLNIEKSDFEYEDEIYKGNVVVKVNYDIYKKLLPFIKESHEEMFLVNLQYENDTWIACGIQRFNLYEEDNESL
ncbi:TcaA 3rd/4th domain-containing protein [Clostridium disporicum]|uniref:Membrane-associated protein n=1 Tax=Clostridium disporicum TaxID=84024 RepID=A0A174J829_9CLOT|nr:hypothetical protein [Clostridium disporicum]CUO93280.1 membrane-associated protein [Clostridium disporicum]